MNGYEKLRNDIKNLSVSAEDLEGYNNLLAVVNESEEAYSRGDSDLIEVGGLHILRDDVEFFKEWMDYLKLDYRTYSHGDSSDSSDGPSGDDEPSESVGEEREIDKIEKLIAAGVAASNDPADKEELDKLLAEKNEDDRKLFRQKLSGNLRPVNSVEDALVNDGSLLSCLSSLSKDDARFGSLMSIMRVSLEQEENKDNLVMIGCYAVLESRADEFIKLLNDTGLNIVPSVNFNAGRAKEFAALEQVIKQYDDIIKSTQAEINDCRAKHDSGVLSDDDFKIKITELEEKLHQAERKLYSLNVRRSAFIKEKEFIENSTVIFPLSDSGDIIKNTQQLAKELDSNLSLSFNCGTLLGIVRASLEPENQNKVVKVGNYSILESRVDEFIKLMKTFGLSIGASYYEPKIEELKGKNNVDDLVKIKEAYYKIIDDVVNNFDNGFDFENSTVQQLDDKIKELVENHERYSDLKNWENFEKLDKELKEDINKKLVNKLKRTQKAAEEKNQNKIWLKALAGAAGFAVGVGINAAIGAVPVLGSCIMVYAGARSLYQAGKLGCAIATKINKGVEPAIITKFKDKIPEKIKKAAAIAFEKPKNPYAKWFVNGASLGYMADRIFDISGRIGNLMKPQVAPTQAPSPSPEPTAETTGNGIKTDWSEYDRGIVRGTTKPVVDPTPEPVVPVPTPEPIIPEIQPGDVIDLSGLQNGFASSYGTGYTSLDVTRGVGAIFDKSNVVNGETWYHFLQPNGAGYAWFKKSDIDELLKATVSNGRSL